MNSTQASAGAICRDSQIEVPCRQQDNAERLHEALKGMQNILIAQQDFLAKLVNEDTAERLKEGHDKAYTPSLQVLLMEAPNEINSITDQATAQVQSMQRILYGEM